MLCYNIWLFPLVKVQPVNKLLYFYNNKNVIIDRTCILYIKANECQIGSFSSEATVCLLRGLSCQWAINNHCWQDCPVYNLGISRYWRKTFQVDVIPPISISSQAKKWGFFVARSWIFRQLGKMRSISEAVTNSSLQIIKQEGLSWMPSNYHH